MTVVVTVIALAVLFWTARAIWHLRVWFWVRSIRNPEERMKAELLADEHKRMRKRK